MIVFHYVLNKKDPKEKNRLENIQSDDVKITPIQKNNILEINNKSLITSVQKVTLYDMTGQSIAARGIENQIQEKIEPPIKNLSPGVYIAKIKTSIGDFSKKIIIL